MPNPDRAIVPIAKLARYTLNASHRVGGHKARVFRSALGLTDHDAEWLREQILRAAVEQDAELKEQTKWGQLYMLDFEISTSKGRAVIATGWIVQRGEDFPRLTTCFVRPTP